MCGIFGITCALKSTPDEGKLRQSVASLSHRGPDAGVVHAEPGLGLVHARLSLVDTSSRSDQPFWDESGRYVLIFNGEVYNFKELRSELEKRGRRFRTTSDTEVVLQMLIEYGPEKALPRLDGMFALGFFDRKAGQLVLARDRFGMKPLFYATSGTGFLFASEVKAMRPFLELKPDLGSVAAYLMKFGGPTKGVTFFDGVEELAPGYMLVLSRGVAPQASPFFVVTDFLDDAEFERLSGLTDTQVVDEFEERITRAVASHAFADASVGAFCSGGVDSSLIVALAAKIMPDIALFHAEVKGAWSEAPAARALAEHLKLDIHKVEVEEEDFVSSIPRVMRHYEYPFTYHPNCAPLMTIAELARDSGVKGLLSGEGSDELFLGYPWLGRKRLTDAYDRTIGAIGYAVRGIPAVGRILNPDRMGNFHEVRDILNGREIADDLNTVTEALSRHPAHAADPRTRWTLDYLGHHLRTLLHRNDTMGMAASIEARFPFLDNQLANFGVNLPARHKLKRALVWEKAHPFMRDKWVVRAVADRHIPPNLSQRIKIGFWTTVFQRLEIADQMLVSDHLGEVLRLSSRQLRALAAEASPDLKLRLMHLDIWHRTCIAGEADEVSQGKLADLVTIVPEGSFYTRRVNRTPQRTYPSAPT
jgi:asparagine synthase (glutamine-hydrolysing)